MQRIREVASESIDPGAVFVLDGIFELFVIIGAEARGNRRDIFGGMSVAKVRSCQEVVVRVLTLPLRCSRISLLLTNPVGRLPRQSMFSFSLVKYLWI